jgi:hypothetical protein
MAIHSEKPMIVRTATIQIGQLVDTLRARGHGVAERATTKNGWKKRAMAMNNLQSMGTATAGRAQGDTGEKDERLALERFSTSSVSANASARLDMLLWQIPPAKICDRFAGR